MDLRRPGISRLLNFYLDGSVLLQLCLLDVLGGIVLLPVEPPSSSWPLDLGR